MKRKVFLVFSIQNVNASLKTFKFQGKNIFKQNKQKEIVQQKLRLCYTHKRTENMKQ